MSLPIIRTPKARADLLRVWSYIADDNEKAADAMIDRFERTFAMLADSPLAGRARPEVAEGLRSFAVGSYVVFYRAMPEAVAVVRVLNGFQDIPAADFS